MGIEGVVSYRKMHVWQLNSEQYIGSLIVEVTPETNQKKVTRQVLDVLHHSGLTQISVQIEKDAFFQHISSLLPGYQIPQRTNKPLHQTLFVKAI